MASRRGSASSPWEPSGLASWTPMSWRRPRFKFRHQKKRKRTSKRLEHSENYWFSRHSKSIIFLIVMLSVVGVYEALSIPVAVFPTTNFPRIIIGVDNGVMPIEQMEVTITRPLEEAIRAV